MRFRRTAGALSSDLAKISRDVLVYAVVEISRCGQRFRGWLDGHTFVERR